MYLLTNETGSVAADAAARKHGADWFVGRCNKLRYQANASAFREKCVLGLAASTPRLRQQPHRRRRRGMCGVLQLQPALQEAAECRRERHSVLVTVDGVQAVTHENQICAIVKHVVWQVSCGPGQLPALDAAAQRIKADIVC